MQWTVKVGWQWIHFGSRGLYLENVATVNVHVLFVTWGRLWAEEHPFGHFMQVL